MSTVATDASSSQQNSPSPLLEMRVSELLELDPRVLPLLIDSGFTPLANGVMRRALAPTVTLEQAIRIKGLDAQATARLLERLEELRPCHI